MKKELNINNKFVEVIDENGNSITGIKGIQIYKNSLLIYTEKAFYSNNANIFKRCEKISTIDSKTLK